MERHSFQSGGHAYQGVNKTIYWCIEKDIIIYGFTLIYREKKLNFTDI